MAFLNSCQCWHLSCVVTHGCSFSIASPPPATFPQARPPRARAPLGPWALLSCPHLGTCVPAAPSARNAPAPIMHTIQVSGQRSEVRGQIIRWGRVTGSGQEARLGGVSGDRVPEAGACGAHSEPRAGGGRAPGCRAGWRRETAAGFCRPGVVLWVVDAMPVKWVAAGQIEGL